MSRPLEPPIDPAIPGRLALRGRIVTMDAAGRTLADGCVYVEGGVIVDIKNASAAPPAGFSSGDVVATKGTIFPGLIELHNHLPYNVLRLWHVPRAFSNRGQWGVLPEYGLKVSGPMKVIGGSAELMPAVVRYVEAKCLISGVTTTQGIALFSSAGAARYYRGIVRNVEQTAEDDLPEALTRVADVDAKSISSFEARLKKTTCLLLHLAEGIDETAREHFLSLEESNGTWAIEQSLAGIHCAALHREDFARLARKRASIPMRTEPGKIPAASSFEEVPMRQSDMIRRTCNQLLYWSVFAMLQAGCYVAAPPPPPSSPPGPAMAAPPPGAACLAWRQTAQCSATGRREPHNDKSCQMRIQPGWSGFCECAGGAIIGADCGHPTNDCNNVCRQAFWSEAPPPPAPAPGAACLAWRQTAECSATGRREPHNDKGCQAEINPGWSGFCECEGGAIIGADCGHPPSTCAEACRAGGWRR